MATNTNPRTAVRDAILAGVGADHGDEAVRAIEDVTLTSTEVACLSGHELLDWDEYRRVAL